MGRKTMDRTPLRALLCLEATAGLCVAATKAIPTRGGRIPALADTNEICRAFCMRKPQDLKASESHPGYIYETRRHPSVVALMSVISKQMET